ncbi:endonuclease/exonuclease/phosphatase family protein [Actinoplanes sp. NPDC024001]|uniref:endonuclease/exonuclease/phosphatase family protein n=1 Tax=Actinoplanes sp. NPDC024001 TaxID=3154598 RepID=UPI0033C7F5F2
MRVATLNVFGAAGEWSRRRAILRAEFQRLAADLVTLQETMLEPDQAREVLGPDYRLVQSQAREDSGRGITTASRWPVGQVAELDLRVTPRTYDFACTAQLVEVLAPAPFGRVWLVHHLPDYQLDHERERVLQAVVVARAVEERLAESPGHVVLAGDLDAEPDADSLRFLTGRHVAQDMSVCYRCAWDATHPGGGGTGGDTFVPENPYCADWDWPNRRIDHILVRCGEHGGPTLRVAGCRRTFDQPDTVGSDHYGLVADLADPGADRG